MDLNFDKKTIRLLYLLLLADLCFIVVHIFYMTQLLPQEIFSIEKDLGFAEVYQYIKEYWIVILLIILAIKKGKAIYFAWASLFTYILLDDSLRIHERLGRYLVGAFDLQPMFNLRGQDYGELSVSLFFGFVLFGFIIISYIYSDHIAKLISKHLFVLVMGVAFCGIVVDMLHIAVPWGKAAWGLIEDGGEMLVMSVIVWYVFELNPYGTDIVSLKIKQPINAQ